MFIWAGNTIVTKLAAGNIPPGVIAFGRWMIAFAILTPFVAGSVWRHRQTVRSHLWKLAVLGFLGMAFCQGIAYYAAFHLDLAGLALAGYGILLRNWSGPLPTFTSLYVQIGWTLVFLLPGFLLERSATFSASNVAILLYAAIAGSIVAPFVWMKAVHHLGANRISIFMNLIPIITAIAAAMLLGESLHAYHVVGGGLTIGGIILNQRNTVRTPQPVAAAAEA